MTVRKLQNTGYLKWKCWMAISAEYVVEEAMDLSHRLRYDDNNWARGWKAEIQGFDSWRGQGGFIYTKASRSALWATQLPLKWYRKDILLE
jgi:hypothetical protein